MENAKGIFHNGYFFSSLARAMREDFLALHTEILKGFLGKTPTKVWETP